jgi:uncharacterized protein
VPMSLHDRSALSAGSEEKSRLRRSRWLVWLEIIGVVWLYYALIVVCVAVPPFVVPEFGWQLNFREGTAVTFGCTVVANFIALGVLRIWLRRQNLTFYDLDWRPPFTRSSMAIAVVVAIAYSSFTLLLPELREDAAELSLFKLWDASCSLFAAAVEEIIFRGYILTVLERNGSSFTAQVLTSGIAFGVVHIGYAPWAIAMTLLLGVVLAWLYLLGRRSLAAPIVCHGLINVIIEPWLLLYTIELYARIFAS